MTKPAPYPAKQPHPSMPARYYVLMHHSDNIHSEQHCANPSEFLDMFVYETVAYEMLRQFIIACPPSQESHTVYGTVFPGWSSGQEFLDNHNMIRLDALFTNARRASAVGYVYVDFTGSTHYVWVEEHGVDAIQDNRRGQGKPMSELGAALDEKLKGAGRKAG